MKIATIIVTFNRLELLKKSINSVLTQSHPVDKIIIVNNNSTDGTYGYLNTLSQNNRFIIINLKKNEGGAGGFYEGLRRAVLDNYDWGWVMDDDTILNNNALEELLKIAVLEDKIGFVCSKVLWKNGDIHKMNIPTFYTKNDDNFPAQHYANITDVLRVKSASFVSLVIRCNIVRKIGLPIKEIFIWGDDVEFTNRICENGYIGLYAKKSIAYHYTLQNYTPDIISLPREMKWKYYYEIRNKIYAKRKRKNIIVFFFSYLNYYRLTLRKINKRSDSKKDFFIIANKAFKDGLFFNPKISYVNGKSDK